MTSPTPKASPAAVTAVQEALDRLGIELTRSDCQAAADAALAGFVEEGCCDGTYRDREEFGKYSVYTCADMDRTCRTRPVGPWSS